MLPGCLPILHGASPYRFNLRTDRFPLSVFPAAIRHRAFLPHQCLNDPPTGGSFKHLCFAHPPKVGCAKHYCDGHPAKVGWPKQRCGSHPTMRGWLNKAGRIIFQKGELPLPGLLLKIIYQLSKRTK